MTTTELKWYVTAQIGSKINKNKIYENKQLYKKLKSILGTDNIDVMLNYLHSLGFIITNNHQKENISTSVKTYYIEPQPYEAPKPTIEYKNYYYDCIYNNKNKMKSYYREKRKEKINNGLSKPYYRENTNYNSIW